MEPVRGGVEAGLRLGVGKAEQESFYTAADNVVRKKLEVELQADENQERRGKREVQPALMCTEIQPMPRPVTPPSCFHIICAGLVCVLSGSQTLLLFTSFALCSVIQSLSVNQSLQSC